MNHNRYILQHLLPAILTPAGQKSENEPPADSALLHIRALDRVADANARLREADSSLEFLVARNTGRLVVSLVSHETDTIIRNYSYQTVTQLMDHMIEMCRTIHADHNGNPIDPGPISQADTEKDIPHE